MLHATHLGFILQFKLPRSSALSEFTPIIVHAPGTTESETGPAGISVPALTGAGFPGKQISLQ